MAGVINAEHHDRAMQVVKATLTFASADSGSITDLVTTHSYYGYGTQVFIDYGGTAPTNLWDLDIEDEFGVNLLNDKGDNLAVATDPTTITQADLDNGMACSGRLTFKGTNGGTSDGVAVIYVYIARYQ